MDGSRRHVGDGQNRGRICGRPSTTFGGGAKLNRRAFCERDRAGQGSIDRYAVQDLQVTSDEVVSAGVAATFMPSRPERSGGHLCVTSASSATPQFLTLTAESRRTQRLRRVG